MRPVGAGWTALTDAVAPPPPAELESCRYQRFAELSEAVYNGEGAVCGAARDQPRTAADRCINVAATVSDAFVIRSTGCREIIVVFRGSATISQGLPHLRSD